MSDLSVEPAARRDLLAIKGLLEELIAAVEDDESFDVDQALRNCSAMMDDPHAYMMVAREKNDVVGFINLTTRNTVLHSAPSGMIDELVVAETCRGRGVGHKLVEAAILKCRELGCSEIEVSTEKNNEEARRFYAACGFQEEAVLLELHLEDAG